VRRLFLMDKKKLVKGGSAVAGHARRCWQIACAWSYGDETGLRPKHARSLAGYTWQARRLHHCTGCFQLRAIESTSTFHGDGGREALGNAYSIRGVVRHCGRSWMR
jgi:hypothetical protein